MKNIWIMNHYATDNFFNEGGRHYWFAENLQKKGYKVTIFCANTRHNSVDSINIEKGIYTERVKNRIPFVFVKSKNYISNNHNRVLNMISFTKRLFKVTSKYKKKYGEPDVIIASSVHPLTLVAGLKIAKKMGVPCITEIRDLWPESIIAYGLLSERNVISRLMYRGEKWIYKRSDSIIMTWEGGYDYIKNKGWFDVVDKNKIHYISNGVVIRDFNENKMNYQINDEDLASNTQKNFIYTGSIRKVNNLELLVQAAKIIQDEGYNDIKLIIYGDGDERNKLETLVKNLKLNNIVFKGKVLKRNIPYILSKSYVNILHNSSTKLDKYGQSQNKFFEYLASGKPIIQTYRTGYSTIDKYNCGLCVLNQNPENIAKAIISFANDENETQIQGNNSKLISKEYDFENLTNKLINIIESQRI